MHSEVAVIGAGPVGLVAGRVAADGGLAVEIVERRRPDGVPSCCTGLVSPATLSVLGASNASVLRTIRAIRLILPSGRSIELRARSDKAVVLDRVLLERELRRQAEDAGAQLHFGSEAMTASPGTVRIRSENEDRTIHPSIIIAADGPGSQVASWFSLEPPRLLVSAAQADVAVSAPCEDRVDLFIGESVAPGFFGWAVPAEPGVVRVGVGVTPPHAPVPHLDRLLDARFPGARVLARSAGQIPLERAARPAADGLLLVGDAAGHVKPLSGGGLYIGGSCARIAGELAIQAIRDPARRRQLSSCYLKRCTEAVGRELTFGTTIRHYLSRLHDADVEKLADAIDDPQLLDFLADRADIDAFHRLPDHLSADPRLWASMLRLVPLFGSHLS